MDRQEAEELAAASWERYFIDRTLDNRNALLLQYGSLVRYIASRVAAGLPPSVSKDDLISWGTVGLVQAIEKFEPDRGWKFETFAVPGIRGRMIDGLRKEDVVPRSVRTKAKELVRAGEALKEKLGRDPEDAELAEELEITVSELWIMQRDAAVSATVALDEHDGDDDRPSLSSQLSDPTGNPEDLFVAQGEVAELVAAAVDTLPERAKIIVVLYYLEEMTLAEIGEVLGVTESRVCQLQGQLLGQLREALQSGLAA